MTFVRLLPVLLAVVVLGAHFLRVGQWGALVATGVAPLLLLVKRRWAARLVQTLLVGAAVYWLAQLALLAGLRQRMGMGWARLAVILLAVALATATAALVLDGRRLRQRYPQTGSGATAPVVAFWLTAVLLAFVQVKLARPMLLAERFWVGGGWPTILGLAVYAAWVTELLLDPARQARTRHRIWLAFSAVFFLQLVFGLAGVERMLMSGQLHLPVPAVILGGPLYRGHGFFMPVLFGITVLLTGPAWCSYFCYIGAWDSGLARGRRPKPAASPWARRLRWITLAGVVVVALGLRGLGVSSGVAVALGAAFGVVGVGVMLIGSRRSGTMTHCTYYCPLGLLATGLGRLSPHRIRITDSCTACGRCRKACRYDALSKADLERGRPGSSCTLCGDCVGRCEHSAIEYRFPGLSPARSRQVFFVLVACFHAGCIAVARI